MGTNAPIKRVVTEPKRSGNPFIVVPAEPAGPEPARPEPAPVPERELVPAGGSGRSASRQLPY